MIRLKYPDVWVISYTPDRTQTPDKQSRLSSTFKVTMHDDMVYINKFLHPFGLLAAVFLVILN